MMTLLWILVVALWVLFFAVTLALLALYRHFGQMYMGLPEQKLSQGPEIGSAMPSLALVDTRGRKLILPAGRPTALIFASTTCAFCTEIREALSAPSTSFGDTELVVLCSGPKSDVEAWAGRTAEAVHVVWDNKGRLRDRFEVNGTPFGVAIGRDSRIRAKGIVNGVEGIEWAATEARSLPVSTTGALIEETVAR